MSALRSGPLFTGFLTVAERCSHCGLDLRNADSGDGPAVFVVFILGALVVPLALLLRHGPNRRCGYMSPFGLWSILGAALAPLRPMKGMLIALQYHHRASDSGTQSYD